jgi:hypothetical protein
VKPSSGGEEAEEGKEEEGEEAAAGWEELQGVWLGDTGTDVARLDGGERTAATDWTAATGLDWTVAAAARPPRAKPPPAVIMPAVQGSKPFTPSDPRSGPPAALVAAFALFSRGRSMFHRGFGLTGMGFVSIFVLY